MPTSSVAPVARHSCGVHSGWTGMIVFRCERIDHRLGRKLSDPPRRVPAMNKMLASLKRLRQSVTTLAAAGWSEGEAIDGLDELFAIEQQLAAVRLSMVNDLIASKVPARQAATSAAAWLGGVLHISHCAAGKMIRLAKALPATTPETGNALAAGKITVDQAAAIVQAVNRLPEACKSQGEAHMLGLASELDSAQLRNAGLHLHDEVDAAGARQRRGERLAARARRRAARRGLHLSDVDGDDMVHLSGRMEPATADVLRAALDPDRVPDSSDQSTETRPPAADPRTPAARRLDALRDICLSALAETSTGDSSRPGADHRRPATAKPARSDRRRSRRQRRRQPKKHPAAGVQRAGSVRGNRR